MADINVTLLKTLLSYDPINGKFYWRVDKSKRVRKGNVAGSLSHGYINIGINGKLYSAHRLAWLYKKGKYPKKDIDHINGIKSDNRWNNLRLASESENLWNRKICTRNTTGVKGVHWYKASNKWEVAIRVKNKKVYLGRYDDFKNACRVVNKARKKHHGSFARFL